MDQATYWAIADADIEIQNPVTDRKLRLLDDYCDIRDGLNVLDIGCGKAWVMRHWAERFRSRAPALETNPASPVGGAAASPRRAAGSSSIEGRADGSTRAARRATTSCSASARAYALGGFVEAVDWMVAAAKPGGAVVIGELTLKHRPAVYTAPASAARSARAARIIERHGAEVSALISASDADFERYASHHRHATLRWAREHPDHPDHDDVLDKSGPTGRHYLQDDPRRCSAGRSSSRARPADYSATAGAARYSTLDAEQSPALGNQRAYRAPARPSPTQASGVGVISVPLRLLADDRADDRPAHRLQESEHCSSGAGDVAQRLHRQRVHVRRGPGKEELHDRQEGIEDPERHRPAEAEPSIARPQAR